MDKAALVLEYIRVLLSTPVMCSVVALVFIFVFREDLKALILRIAKIKLPGGTEVSTPQSKQLPIEEHDIKNKPVVNVQIDDDGLPPGLTHEQQEEIEQVIRSHIVTSRIWEYRYLNYFLVRGTQIILDWFINLPQATTYGHYEACWTPIIPSGNEKQAIINALESHHLIQVHNHGLIAVTDKGREYAKWRGPLQPIENT